MVMGVLAALGMKKPRRSGALKRFLTHVCLQADSGQRLALLTLS